MAGDWIKLEKATLSKPEVFAIADHLGIHELHAFGLCVSFWAWCDDHIENCHASSVTKNEHCHVPSVTKNMIDRRVGVTGFAESLQKVGWLVIHTGDKQGVTIPNFDRHISVSAKSRSLSALRQGKKRLRDNHDDVTPMSRSDRDEIVTREEKRREEIKTKDNTPLPPKGGAVRTKRKPAGADDSEWSPEIVSLPYSGRFAEVWEQWVAIRRAKGRKHAVTNRIARLSLQKLEGLTEQQATDCVFNSAAGGWDGLFPEKVVTLQTGKPPPALTFKTQEAILVQESLRREAEELKAQERAAELAAKNRPLAIGGAA